MDSDLLQQLLHHPVHEAVVPREALPVLGHVVAQRTLVHAVLLHAIANSFAEMTVGQVSKQQVVIAKVVLADGAHLALVLGLEQTQHTFVEAVLLSLLFVEDSNNNLVINAVVPCQSFGVLALESAAGHWTSKWLVRRQVGQETVLKVFVARVTQ